MHSSLRASLSGLLLTALLASSPLAALSFTVTDGDESASLVSQGWSETSPGLWERETLEGQKETFVSSAEGLRSILPRLKEEAQKRFADYLAKPSAENQRAYDEQKALLDSVVANLQAPAAPPGKAKNRLQSQGSAAVAAACTRTYDYWVSLGGTHCTDQANAYASYSTSNPTACPQQCTVHAYSYHSGTPCPSGSPYTQSDSCALTGTNVTCLTETYGGFAKNCYFYAFASIHCPALNNLFLSQSGTNSVCRCTC